MPQPPLKQVGVAPRGTTRSSQVEGPIKAHITTAQEQLSAPSSGGSESRVIVWCSRLAAHPIALTTDP